MDALSFLFSLLLFFSFLSQQEVDLSLASLSISEMDVTADNVFSKPLAVQDRFLSHHTDLRIRQEEAYPRWLREKLFEDMIVEVKEEIVKEAVADVRHTNAIARAIFFSLHSASRSLLLSLSLPLCSHRLGQACVCSV